MWKSMCVSVCMGRFDNRGGLCMLLDVSSSAWAVSLILHAHREWRMTSEYIAGGGHVMLIAIFTFFSFFLCWGR